MAKELDTAVEAFRTRPLDVGPYTFVAADALVLKVREAGRVVPTPPTARRAKPVRTTATKDQAQLVKGNRQSHHKLGPLA
jgi:hypothetical protein